MACMEDDAIGDRLTVFREQEVDCVVLGESNWEAVAQRGFDRPRQFTAYRDTCLGSVSPPRTPTFFGSPIGQDRN